MNNKNNHNKILIDGLYRYSMVFILAFVLILGSAVVLWHTHQQTKEISKKAAIVDARDFASSVSQFRNFYSKTIVPKACNHGMKINHNYLSESSSLPLPATFAKDFAKSLSVNNSAYSVKLYSDLPFPWRKNEVIDEFEKNALEKIKKSPSQEVWSFETIKGVQVLRYAKGDILKESCVSCHNNYSGTPKKDWKAGDVRGVLEVIRPISAFESESSNLLKNSFLMMLALILSMVMLLFFILRKLTGSMKSIYEAYVKEEKLTKELTASDVKMRAIVDSVEEVIIVIDGKGIISECNNSMQKVFGYTQEEVIGQNVSILMTGNDHTNHDKYITDFITNQEGTVMGQNREFIAIRKNGESFPIELFVNDARIGNEIIFTGSIRDVTYRKKTQEINEKAHKAAIESAELKSEFLANMSHEIRTPMNGVIGMTEMLLLSKLDEEQTDLAHNVKDSADSLLTIINDILDFSKIEAGKLKIRKNKFPLLKMIEASMELISKEATRKQVELAFFIDKNVPLEIEGDSGRLRQILINLFNNALKFTESGHVILYVTSIDDSTLSFSIIDSGIGIPEDALATLFESFSQVDGSSSREYGGTGLGLAICKQLVTLMDGEIGVKSDVGSGSTFWFTIKIEPIPDYKIEPVITINTNVLMWSTSDTLNRFYKKQLSQWGMDSTIVKNLNMLNTLLDKQSFEMLALDADNIFIDPNNPSSSLPLIETLREKSDAVFVLYANRLQYQKLVKLKFDKKTILFKKPIKHTAIKELLTSFKEKNVAIKQNTQSFHSNEIAITQTEPPIDEPKKLTIRSLKDKFHLLIAEDNVVNQKVAMKMLSNLGCKVSIVKNGREALDQVTNNYFDAIFMDCQMPDLDGYEATKLIRQLPIDHHSRDIPIVAFTANAMKDDQRLCKESGMDDYLCKPVSIEKLEIILNKWLEKLTIRQTKHMKNKQ